ncbi:hypothetical protein E2C01_083981 [Portunus trituberculatus]|uniref:Uncharacterized protein n=1 Tax=Portunus trituberculatus TaxID=210409 RepID=A0A5B7J3N4_PORTR|nr:hypothetical protein [Portunus trituberculatus]
MISESTTRSSDTPTPRGLGRWDKGCGSDMTGWVRQRDGTARGTHRGGMGRRDELDSNLQE